MSTHVMGSAAPVFYDVEELLNQTRMIRGQSSMDRLQERPSGPNHSINRNLTQIIEQQIQIEQQKIHSLQLLSQAAAAVNHRQGTPILGAGDLAAVVSPKYDPTTLGSPSKHELEAKNSTAEAANAIKQSPNNVNTSRYKTELCRPFEESGYCKYGEKCQFAHGIHEQRNLVRHPKYKTELCRTFHTVGVCPYGPRCHFVHNDVNKSAPSSAPSSPTAHIAHISPQAGSVTPSVAIQRPKALNFNQLVTQQRHSLGSSGESPSGSPTFSDELGLSSLSPPSGSGRMPAAFTFTGYGLKPQAQQSGDLDDFDALMVQTDAIASLTASFQAATFHQHVLANNNNQEGFPDRYAPASPPHSMSSSAGSSDVESSPSLSPSEWERTLRLPIFSQIASEETYRSLI